MRVFDFLFASPSGLLSFYRNPRKYFWGFAAGATGNGDGTLVTVLYGPVTFAADCNEPYGHVTAKPLGGPSKLNLSFSALASTTAPANDWLISEGVRMRL